MDSWLCGLSHCFKGKCGYAATLKMAEIVSAKADAAGL